MSHRETPTLPSERRLQIEQSYRLVMPKLWQAQDSFAPARLTQKFEDGRDFDWDDLRQLLNGAVVIDR